MYGKRQNASMKSGTVDALVLLAIVLLVGWVIAALVFEGPGWVHGVLTLAVFLLIYRIVARATRRSHARR